MNSTAAVGIGSDRWHVRTHVRLMAAVKRTSALRLSASGTRPSLYRWKMVLSLLWLIRLIDGELRNLDKFAQKFQVDMVFPAVENSRITRDALLRWYEACLPFLASREPDTRTSMVQKQCARLGKRAERLMDRAYWFDALSRPEEIRARFETALADLAKGDAVPISTIRRV